MARPVLKTRVKEVPLSEIKDDLSRFLREAETQDVVITRHGKPAGVLMESRVTNAPPRNREEAAAKARARGCGLELPS